MLKLTIDPDIKKLSNSRILERQFVPFMKDRRELPSCEFFVFPSACSAKCTTFLGNAGSVGFYSSDDGWLLEKSGFYAEVSPDFRSVELKTLPGFLEDEISVIQAREMSNTLLQAYKYTVLSAGGLSLHGACAIHYDKGILFCGESGAGKSTQSRLWVKHLGAWQLNNDQPTVFVYDDGVRVSGSPWSGKEDCYVNSSARLNAIVFVKKSKSDSVRRLSGAEAFSLIYLNNYVFPLNKAIEKQYADTVSALAQGVPVFELSCTMTEQAVITAYNAIFGVNSDYKNEKKVMKMKYKQKDFLEVREIADDKVLVPRGAAAIDFSSVIILNDTGALMWELLAEPHTCSELAKHLALAYSVDAEVALADVEKFIAKMLDDGIIDAVG